jgi:ribonuclease VapC
VTAVLDASAVLTLLYRETGHEKVADLVDGSVISSVNWSEVVQKLAQRGLPDSAEVAASLLALGTTILPFTRHDAEVAAALWPACRAHGLSLGDRACLAVAQALPAPLAVTADLAWADADSGVDILILGDHKNAH